MTTARFQAILRVLGRGREEALARSILRIFANASAAFQLSVDSEAS